MLRIFYFWNIRTGTGSEYSNLGQGWTGETSRRILYGYSIFVLGKSPGNTKYINYYYIALLNHAYLREKVILIGNCIIFIKMSHHFYQYNATMLLYF